MPQILAELDPHSTYISAKDVQTANDDLRGSFSGVGIEFVIRHDTLRVQNVISEGPAEQAGVLAGDKIVTVDDSVFTGKSLTNDEAMRLYDQYAHEALELMKRKNHDYDEAWRSMRVSSYTDFILTKIERIKEIENLQGETLVSEGIDSNYMDIINYAVFGVIKLTEEEK